MEKCGKMCENVEECGKMWKMWKNVEKCVKMWKNVENVENVEKCVKMCENMLETRFLYTTAIIFKYRVRFFMSTATLFSVDYAKLSL